jgi:hypothetical protein
MKTYLLFFIIPILVTFGCKYTPEPPTLNSSITVSSDTLQSLEGGGRWFDGADTGVWYDLNISYTLKNISGSDKDITYKAEIGKFINGKFQPGNGDLFYDADSIFTGSFHLAPNATQSLNILNTIGIGRKNSRDWSFPYGFRITLIDKANNESLVLEASLAGSNPQNRFHGIIYTTESSPDPLGVFDGPDDGDWEQNKVNNIGLYACFPNPASRSTVSRFTIPNRDSIVLTLNKTKRSIMSTIISETLDEGTYDVDIVDSTMKDREYRMYGRFFDKGIEYISHGDLLWTKY